MEANWSSYLSNMNALDFAHTGGGTRVNPLNAEQVKAIEAKLMLLTQGHDIAVPRQILQQMSTRCQYRPEIMDKIAQQLGSLRAAPNEFLTALRDFKPDFSDESSAKVSMETIGKAFKTILSFPEKERSWVNRSLEALNHHLKKIPADACPEVREFFVKEVPIKFMDKTVLCTLSDILWLCAQSPVLYSFWMKNVKFKTPGIDFEKLGVTHDEYVALKKDLYAFGPLLKNPFLGLGLCRFLEIPALEKEYASRCMYDYQGVFEAYQRGFLPDFERFPDLGKNTAYSLAERLGAPDDNPEKMIQYFLLGAKIAKVVRVERAFVYFFFQGIPNILLSLRRAIEEQMFEDVKDCEYFLSELVFLLEPFECCYNISPNEFVSAYFNIYEMLLVHNRIHPIPEVLERYRNKLSTIISKDNFPVYQIHQSLQKDKATHNDPWLVRKFVEKALSFLNLVTREQFRMKGYPCLVFEALINIESQSELKEIATATQKFFADYIEIKAWDISYFEARVEKIGRLQAALSSEEDDFVLLTPKLELDFRNLGGNLKCLTSIATHLKVDKIHLAKTSVFGGENFTKEELDEVEKMFAKFPKGTVVWV